MPTPLVRQQIVARIVALLTPLIDGANVRTVKATRYPPRLQSIPAPFVHVLWDDEQEVDQDIRGFTIRAAVHVTHYREDYATNEDAVAATTASIQAAIEADPQLSALVVTCDYKGEFIIINPAMENAGGAQLTYEVTYRRLRGDPTTSY